MEYKLEQNSFAKNECKIKIEHIDVSDAILPHFVKTEIKEDPFESSSLNNSTNSFFVERNSLDQTNKEINTEDIKSDDYFVDRNSLEQMNIEVKTEDIKSEDKSKSVQHENVFKTSRNILIPVKKRLRFREEDDLYLLQEVAGQNPFENPFIWESIKANIYSLSQKDFSIKTLKDHLDLLINAWLEKVKAVKDRSGIEEAYSEKDQLCQNIYDYMIQFRKMSKRKKKNTLHKNKVLGKSASDEWATKLANNAENLATDALKENVSFQDHTYCDFDEINNSIETESIPANIYLSDCNGSIVADFTPEEPSQQPVDINNSTQTQEHSKVLRPKKTKNRKIHVQRQGINYHEKYDQQQKVLKEIENKLEERRIALEERKCALEEHRLSLEEKRLSLEERRLVIQEKKLELDIEKEKNKLTLDKEKQMLEIEEKKCLLDSIKKQNDLLTALVTKMIN
uniref:Uncharacterized protein LOC114330364 isoform X2 n=1 Tax=Diabrotica virgifera virgifera TaxID=50390 RepID=A0A6P7FHD6_DIAVI